MYSKLQYISQGETALEQSNNIASALDAGCRWIQLRFKNVSEKDRGLAAEKVKLLCDQFRATFIVNDHVGLAKAVDADGVHLGLSDTTIESARIMLGPHKIIGGTANTILDVLKRVDEKCNYVGLGPFRFTSTKEKLSPVLGANGYERIMRVLKEKNIQTPIYAIGGIVASDLAALMNSGVYGIAVSGVITHHPLKKAIIDQLNATLYAFT